MDAPLIVFFSSSPHSFVLPFAGESTAGGGFLALLPSLKEAEGSKNALSQGCHTLCGGEEESIALLDDGGEVLLRYRGLHEEKRSEEEAFPLFFPGGLLCALSYGHDIFFPEHGRLLTLGGAELLLIVPSCRPEDQSLLENFARVRAAENQIFTALVLSFPLSPLFFGPEGESLPPVLSPDGGWITLKKEDLRRGRKTFPLSTMRRPGLYHGLTAL